MGVLDFKKGPPSSDQTSMDFTHCPYQNFLSERHQVKINDAHQLDTMLTDTSLLILFLRHIWECYLSNHALRCTCIILCSASIYKIEPMAHSELIATKYW